jgi:hypothetical protein
MPVSSLHFSGAVHGREQSKFATTEKTIPELVKITIFSALPTNHGDGTRSGIRYVLKYK